MDGYTHTTAAATPGQRRQLKPAAECGILAGQPEEEDQMKLGRERVASPGKAARGSVGGAKGPR
jgi:hypothetical protein